MNSTKYWKYNIQPDMFIVVAIFIVFKIFVHIQPDMFVVVAIFILNFGQVRQVNFCRCQFLVMFKFFSHIHSVILNRSCYSYWINHDALTRVNIWVQFLANVLQVFSVWRLWKYFWCFQCLWHKWNGNRSFLVSLLVKAR